MLERSHQQSWIRSKLNGNSHRQRRRLEWRELNRNLIVSSRVKNKNIRIHWLLPSSIPRIALTLTSLLGRASCCICSVLTLGMLPSLHHINNSATLDNTHLHCSSTRSSFSRLFSIKSSAFRSAESSLNRDTEKRMRVRQRGAKFKIEMRNWWKKWEIFSEDPRKRERDEFESFVWVCTESFLLTRKRRNSEKGGKSSLFYDLIYFIFFSIFRSISHFLRKAKRKEEWRLKTTEHIGEKLF